MTPDSLSCFYIIEKVLYYAILCMEEPVIY